MMGVHTLILLAVFIGICVWAYSAHRSKSNDEAAHLPFADDEINQRTLKESEKEK